MNNNNLPGDPLALILGIFALVIGFTGCCCYGITALIPLIIAIVGLSVANKSIRRFNENPEVYSYQSRSNVNTAKIINIIAIVFNGIAVLVFISLMFIYGTIITSVIINGIKNGETYRFNDFEQQHIEQQIDSINENNSADAIFIKEQDSLIIEKVN